MGCQNLCMCVAIYKRRGCAVFYIRTKSTPEPWVRRVANILNKHTIHMIVLNLLATKILVVFHFEKIRRYE